MTQPDRPVQINISGIPVAGVGGLGLVAMAFLVSWVMPAAWWLMVAGVSGGIVVGAVLVLARHGLSTRGPSGSDPTILFRSAEISVESRKEEPPALDPRSSALGYSTR
jgi:hypothetical protein